MFLLILLFPINLAMCYLLPMLGTIYARENMAKWICYWLLVLVSKWTIIPALGLFFECEGKCVASLMFSVALLFLLNNDKVTIVQLRWP